MEGPALSSATAPPLGLRAVAVVLLAVVVPLLLLVQATVPYTSAWAMQLAVVVVAGTALAAVLTTSTLRPLQLAFWLFTYVWLAAAPLAMLTRDTYPWALRADPGVSFRASLLVLTGMLAYLFAVTAAQLDLTGTRDAQQVAGPWYRELTPWRVGVLAVASLLIAVALVPRLGGLGSFFASREASNDATADVAGSSGGAEAALIGWGLSVPAFCALTALIMVRRVPQAAATRSVLRLLLVPVVLVNLVVNNPISQPRYWAGTVLLALLFSTRLLSSVHAFRVAAAGLLVALVVVFPLADYFRYENPTLDRTGVVQQLVTNPDYDAYQQVQAGIMFVDDAGYRPRWALSAPLFWVPRSVWPGKPRDAGPVIAENVGYTFTNLSSPLWIETYIWGGLPVTAVVFGLLGAASGLADRAFHRRRGRPGDLTTMMVPALAFYQFIVLRGSLLQAMAALSLLLVVPPLATRHAGSRTSGAAGAHRLDPMTKDATRS